MENATGYAGVRYGGEKTGLLGLREITGCSGPGRRSLLLALNKARLRITASAGMQRGCAHKPHTNASQQWNQTLEPLLETTQSGPEMPAAWCCHAETGIALWHQAADLV
ncbi:unnamed protein product [Lota lota]